MRSKVLLGLVVLAVSGTLATTSAGAATPNVSSLAGTPVTVYGARWCSACRSLESGLVDRKIAFEKVDVDDHPDAFSRARALSGAGGAIPLTGVVRPSNTVWIVGADVDAIDRAQRGD